MQWEAMGSLFPVLIPTSVLRPRSGLNKASVDLSWGLNQVVVPVLLPNIQFCLYFLCFLLLKSKVATALVWDGEGRKGFAEGFCMMPPHEMLTEQGGRRGSMATLMLFLHLSLQIWSEQKSSIQVGTSFGLYECLFHLQTI